MALPKQKAGTDISELKNRLKKMSKAQINDLKNKFKLFDEDGSGAIDTEELMTGFKKLNLHFNKDELKGLVKEFDVDGSGDIDFDEFCLLFAPGVIEDYRLKCKFEEADADGSGALDTDEIKDLLKSMNIKISDKEFKALIKKVDEDGNNEIDLDEFKVLMNEIDELNLKQLFAQADKDKGGSIDKGELSTLLKETGVYLPDDKVEALFKSVDVDNSGEIDFEEFKLLNKEIDRLMRQQFNSIDADGSGLIDKKETAKMLETLNISMSKKGLEDLFKSVDADGNGELDFDEFKVLLSKLFGDKKNMKIVAAKYLVTDIDGNQLKCADADYKPFFVFFDPTSKTGVEVATKFKKSVKDGKDFYVKFEEVQYGLKGGATQTKSRKVVGAE